MFDALFYLLYVFLHDRRQHVVRGRTSAELQSKGVTNRWRKASDPNYHSTYALIKNIIN
jgi:hypothetical protein